MNIALNFAYEVIVNSKLSFMKKNFVSNSPDSVRMFKNGFLESLSKVHFYVPLLIYIPTIVILSWQSFVIKQLSWPYFAMWFVIGLCVWTLTEYVLHRFVFHFYPKSAIGQRIHFIFHGVHHDYPNDRKRLVMPPSASIPMALVLYFAFALVVPEQGMFSFYAGFLLGYLFYDMSHYALHHANFKSPFWLKLKKHHMLHHYSDPTKGYGVSSTIWDKIMGSDFLKKG